MKREFSYGVIPVYENNKGEYEVLLVQIKAGTWWFPKGQKESGETIQQTAQRELLEETGLTVVERYSEKIFNESYICTKEHQKVDKQVGYFLGRVETKKVMLQYEEINDYARVNFASAQEKLSFPEIKDIAARAQSLLLAKQTN